jgi:putative solute:sodium symporter small subunit
MSEPSLLATRRATYWRANLRLTTILLLSWFGVTFVLGYFARDLTFAFFGWPFSFWLCAQGALVVYGLIIWSYARRMNQLDDRYAIQEPDGR